MFLIIFGKKLPRSPSMEEVSNIPSGSPLLRSTHLGMGGKE
jgi:hypothetical protein